MKPLKVTGRILPISEAIKRRNPHLELPRMYVPKEGGGFDQKETMKLYDPPKPRIRQSTKALLNPTEQRRCDDLEHAGWKVMKQSITLRLDPPFKRYTPDLAYQRDSALVLVEVKGPHRFREKGVAKAALAAKTYPQFIFELHDWDGRGWTVTKLSS